MNIDRVLRTRCVIVGGGPAGVVLGYLLSRAGVDVLVLEKHADFFRDFRGDTIHPSTLQLFEELGLLERLLRIPHSEARALTIRIGDTELPFADFTHVPGAAKYLAFMPQWDFLDFVVREARQYPTFALEMETEVVDLLRDGKKIVGVVARTPQGILEARADLVVAADGRTSRVRESAALPLRDLGAPIDALWMRLSRRTDDPPRVFGNIVPGAALVTIDRGAYYQCALTIRKGAYAEIRAAGLDAFRARLATLAPFLADRVGEITSWDDVKLLTVRVDRLRRWYRDGLLCIGDAAHAMSPVGGVGINLAIQDAVATANALARPLRHGRVAARQLRAVQRRRELPARLTQAVQVCVHKNAFKRVLSTKTMTLPPIVVNAFERFPLLQTVPAYAVGIGVRPEHARSLPVWDFSDRRVALQRS
jgi:2-polyprenyl-6-methoxyphenol hydroxylase-like FAD-dependent oxidoreductase